MANTLADKNILLGISGGIAAYKSAELCRELVRRGAQVRVVMTRDATRFIGPLTLQSLSGHPVADDLFAAENENGMGHIELARWADLVLVAPATAALIAGLAHGHADQLLTATILASRAPLAIAPAMNTAMWEHPATVANVALLVNRGVTILGPATGEQACGETGPGRMLEAIDLADQAEGLLLPPLLAGRRVTVTAGPTWEALDPVRGLTNRSSGKMGYAVTRAACLAGAEVTLVSGPTTLPPPHGVALQRVESAEEMLAAVLSGIGDCDIFIGVAAVADYRPVKVATQKIKKDEAFYNVELQRNPDILATVSALESRPYCVGFAAETGQLEEQARGKLVAKGADLIAANLVGGEDCAFDAESNELLLVDRTSTHRLPRTAKNRLALQLIKEIAKRYETHTSQDPRSQDR